LVIVSVNSLWGADEVVGRERLGELASEALDTSMAGTSSILVVVGGRDLGADRFLRWIVAQRPATATLRWFLGARVEVADFEAVIGLRRERAAHGDRAPLVVGIEGLEFLALDEQRVLRTLVHEVEDANDTRQGPPLFVALSMTGDRDDLLPVVGGSPVARFLELNPLNASAVYDLTLRTAGAKVAPGFADAVYEVSGGRPEAVIRLVSRALSAGWLRRGPDGLELATTLAKFAEQSDRALAVPAKTADAEVARLVDIACCVGPTGSLRLLRTACRSLGDAFDDVLLRACRSQLLDDDGETFWFTDPHEAHAAYERLSVHDRQVAHAAVVEAVVALGDSHAVTDDALLLHVRLAHSRLSAEMRRDVLAGIAARAEGRRRWAAAAAALDLLIRDDGSSLAAQLDLLLRSAEAHYQHSSPGTALERFEAAFALGAELRSPVAERALLRALGIRVETGQPVPDLPPSEPVSTTAAAWLETLHADARFAAGDVKGGLQACDRACALAKRCDNPEVVVRASVSVGLQRLLALSPDEAAASFQDGVRAAQRCSDRLVRAWPASRLGLAQWMRGNEQGARDLAVDAARVGDDAGWWGESLLAHAVLGVAALSQGDLDSASRAAQRSVMLQARSSYAFGLPLALPISVALGAFRGDVNQVIAGTRIWNAHRRVPTLVQQLADRMTGGRPDPQAVPPRRADLFRAGGLVLAAELGDWCDAEALALEPRDELRRLVDRGVVNVPGWPVSVLRAASISAHWAGDDGEAAELVAMSSGLAERSNANLSLVLARYDAARWGFAGDGIEPLAKAIRAFESLGLRSWVARAQTEVDVHAGVAPLGAGLPERVLLYTDLVGSTPLNVRSGDHRFVELLAEHQSAIDECVTEFCGTRFHNTGDGFGVWFLSAPAALACAEAIHHRLEIANRAHPDVRLEVRIGLAAGRPVPFDGDLYGLAVVRAARVCALAGAGQVLLSSEVAEFEALGALRVEFVARHLLKGFDDSTAVYELRQRSVSYATDHALPP
jgi:class 3 adenylate cyclase